MRALLTLCFLAVGASAASAVEWTGSVGAEARFFPQTAAFPDQGDGNLSLLLEPEVYHEWNRGDQSITFTPYLRLDSTDSERTHADIRELVFLYAQRSWELRVGLDRVFWGVTESQHLVDIVNQTDLVENSDGEDKLGQPMVAFKWIPEWGTIDLYVLPVFRPRTFAGNEGRLRTPIRVETERPAYESEAQEAHVDVAARWSHSIDAFDLGLAHFRGTSRDPRFIPGGADFLRPLYEQIHQTSLDGQWTHGGWLLKLEVMRRQGQGQTFSAAVGGFEYTLVGVFGQVWDLGLLTEYHYDDRGEKALTPFEDDVFVGARLVLNDVQSSELLVGGVVDRDSGGTALSLEASRRVGNRWKVSVEARAFMGTETIDPLHAFAQDDYGQVEIVRFF